MLNATLLCMTCSRLDLVETKQFSHASNAPDVSWRQRCGLDMTRLAAVFLAFCGVAGCSSEQSGLPDYKNNPHTPGNVARVERVGWYPAIAIRALFWYASLPEPVSVSDGVELYKVSYWSQTEGKNALLSGLMALPSEGQVRGTVLYMPGTSTNREHSPSNPTIKAQESLFISCAFAGGGYLQ